MKTLVNTNNEGLQKDSCSLFHQLRIRLIYQKLSESVVLGVGPGGEDAGEHDVQVPRRVRLVHRQDLLAPACTLPQRGHHPQEEVRDVRAGLLAHQHGYGKGRAWQHGYGKGRARQHGYGQGRAWQHGYGKGRARQHGFGQGRAWQHGYGKGRAWQHPQEENLDFVGILGFYRNSLQFWMKKNGVRGNPNFGIGKTSKKQQ